MTILSFRKSLLLAGVLCAIGCKQNTSASSSAKGSDSAMPVAKYAGKTLTVAEVDATITAQLKQLEKQKTEMRQNAAEQMAVQALIKEEATKAGVTEDQWVKERVETPIPAPPEDEILKVFNENQARMPPGSTLESMREQIIGYLQQDARRAQAKKVFDELKSKAGYQLLLEEPRVVVEAKGPARGPENAKVTIVEFSDFQCPYCSKAEESVSQVMEQYAGKVRLVYRHFPLSFHSNAAKAAEAAACAEEQGKFWEMHKILFANQNKLAIDDLKAHAAAIGLDASKFTSCLESGKTKSQVDADTKAAQEAGINGTPAFFVNGKLLSGALPVSEFQKVIDAELAK